MKIEQELKNSKPMPPRQRATLNILFTASWLERNFARTMRKFGLTHPQYNILRILKGSAPNSLSVLDIKGRMIDRSSNVSRLVEKLRENQWVERASCQEDRRMVEVSVTEAGLALLAEIEKEGFLNEHNMPGQKLTETEAAQLADLLDKFRE